MAIPRAVRNSDVVLVCLSKSSVNRAGYLQKEIRIALDVADEQPEGAIFLIPVKLEECDLPERLSRWHWVDLSSEYAEERLLQTLLRRADELGATVSSFTFANDPARFLDETEVRRVVLETLQPGI
jgi:TIR domain